MKQEEKELLLKDLCGRLPYGVVVHKQNKELLLKDLCCRLPYGVVVHTDDKDIKLVRNHRGLDFYIMNIIMKEQRRNVVMLRPISVSS